MSRKMIFYDNFEPKRLAALLEIHAESQSQTIIIL